MLQPGLPFVGRYTLVLHGFIADLTDFYNVDVILPSLSKRSLGIETDVQELFESGTLDCTRKRWGLRAPIQLVVANGEI